MHSRFVTLVTALLLLCTMCLSPPVSAKCMEIPSLLRWECPYAKIDPDAYIQPRCPEHELDPPLWIFPTGPRIRTMHPGRNFTMRVNRTGWHDGMDFYAELVDLKDFRGGRDAEDVGSLGYLGEGQSALEVKLPAKLADGFYAIRLMPGLSDDVFISWPFYVCRK